MQLFDYKNELRTGVIQLNMWPDDKANPIGIVCELCGLLCRSWLTVYRHMQRQQQPQCCVSIHWIRFVSAPSGVSNRTNERGKWSVRYRRRHSKVLPKNHRWHRMTPYRKPTLSAKATKLIGIENDAGQLIENLISKGNQNYSRKWICILIFVWLSFQFVTTGLCLRL